MLSLPRTLQEEAGRMVTASTCPLEEEEEEDYKLAPDGGRYGFRARANSELN